MGNAKKKTASLKQEYAVFSLAGSSLRHLSRCHAIGDNECESSENLLGPLRPTMFTLSNFKS